MDDDDDDKLAQAATKNGLLLLPLNPSDDGISNRKGLTTRTPFASSCFCCFEFDEKITC